MAKITFIFCCILFFTLPGCEREENFTLQQECVLSDLVVDTGDCTSDSTYKITINFKYQSAGSDLFEVYTRNNKKIGTYKLSDLPLTIEDFKTSGKEFDFIKIIIKENPDCFAVAEFKPPACKERKCDISNLRTDVGECYADGTYNLTLNFDYQNPGNRLFDVFVREGKLIGTYELAKLPITIKNFKPSGRDYDFIKVVINDRPGCFAVTEFKPPDCKEEECSITDLKADIGECTSKTTYNLLINFKHHHSTNEYFDVFIRDNVRIGTYKLSALPLKLNDFKHSGKDYDFIRICINDNAECCKVLEFKPPVCE